MMGCYDFCGHYEWTFAWLERERGPLFLRQYWEEAISRDSQRHARALVEEGGFAGMARYWGHTLLEESPELGFSLSQAPGVFRIDIQDCPSKGFLLRNGLQQHGDYCDHCIGWIGPMMRDAGFVIDHEHNHCGQCWWEMRRAGGGAAGAAAAKEAGGKDVRSAPNWRPPGSTVDRYRAANGADDKLPRIEPCADSTPQA